MSNELAWSPDSTRIAFTGNPGPRPWFAKYGGHLDRTIRDKAIKCLVDTKGPDRNPVWSPDGKQIAFVTLDGQEFFHYSDSRIAIVSAEGGGKPRTITNKFDEDPDPLAWIEKGLYFAARQKPIRTCF